MNKIKVNDLHANGVFVFKYTRGSHTNQHRTVYITSYNYASRTILGWCFERKGYRTYRLDSIRDVYKLEVGVDYYQISIDSLPERMVDIVLKEYSNLGCMLHSDLNVVIGVLNAQLPIQDQLLYDNKKSLLTITSENGSVVTLEGFLDRSVLLRSFYKDGREKNRTSIPTIKHLITALKAIQ